MKSCAGVLAIGSLVIALLGLGAGQVRGETDGSIVAWGHNNLGQCDAPSPNAGFVAVAARGNHNVGLRANGMIDAWGWNSNGQSDDPVGITDFVAVAAGYYNSY
jgi:alpha-tubulin suppressor-like RCC1 family protein